ncbi:hypothetical protein ElyMa_006282400 [Elysia marginata]|uniref:Uncharacterized protein n=1 Tax=Elysia marginata TaxID=1093978 RepID=A0AAV4HCF3_9GAST|nr:hypothetical protein ElyMa_006282400 [Elysia marginata]
MTKKDLSKLSSFHTRNIRKIARILWPPKISDEELLNQCQQESMEKDSRDGDISHGTVIGHPDDAGSAQGSKRCKDFVAALVLAHIRPHVIWGRSFTQLMRHSMSLQLLYTPPSIL